MKLNKVEEGGVYKQKQRESNVFRQAFGGS